MISRIRVAVVFIVASLYVIAGLLLKPFGKTGAFYRWISPNFGKVLLFLSGGRPTWSGLEKLNPLQSYIFVGNHQSYVDIFLLQMVLGQRNMRILFMAKEELNKIPLFGIVMKNMGLIPIAKDDNRKAMNAVLDAMKKVENGYSIVIFPEGTRTENGDINPFKRGAFLLADKSGKPIVPFILTGTGYIFPKKKIYMKKGSCSLRFMDPIQPGDLSSKELAVKVEEIIRTQYEIDRKIIDAQWQK